MLGEVRWRRLCRRFLRDGALHTPWFREIPQEFVRFLAALPAVRLPRWLAELAHYEWAELAVDVMDAPLPSHDPAGDLLDGDKLYFTSQGKYLWCCTIGSGGAPAISWKASLGGTSTSTPTKVGDRIYVGYYSGFSAGGVQCVGASGSHTVTTVASGFPVQCSILVPGAGTGTD